MLVKRLKYLIAAALVAMALCNFQDAKAQDAATEKTAAAPEKKGGFDVGEIIMEHVKDAHEWHFFTIGKFQAVLPLPVIIYVPNQGFSIFLSSRFHHGTSSYDGFCLMSKEFIAQYHLDPSTYFTGKIIAINADGSPNIDKAVYDISISRNVAQMLVSAILLILIFVGVTRKYAANPGKAPSGFQNAIEPLVMFIRDDIGRPMMGNKADKYLPYLLTVFFFIWINSLLGLIPGSANVPGNIAFTFVLAVFTFILIMACTNNHYWKHIFWPPGVPVPVKLILIPIEILGIFTKPFALMIRLFANMLAGHLVIVSILSLIFIFGAMNIIAGWGFSAVSVAFTVFMYFLELLVGVIQAYIFTSLSALFIAQAFESEDHAVQGHEAVEVVA